jgi:imidazolonepropionase-like amidohydrolase
MRRPLTATLAPALALALALAPALPAAAAPTCLTGATVTLPDGPAEVTVAFEGGVITAVGEAPAGCEAIDASGLRLTPGLIEPHSGLGLVEVGLEGATRDADAGGDAVRAAFKVADAYNPRSTLIPVARREGLTEALTLPGGGIISGQAAAVQLTGATQAEAVLDDSVALVVNLGARGEGSRAAALQELAELLDDAAQYAANRGGYERGAARDYAASRLDLEALQPALRGELPLIIHLDRASDIEALLRFLEGRRERVILAGAAEAWLVADALAERQIPVILDPLTYGPGGFDQIFARPDSAALLVEAGVPVMFSTFNAHNIRKLRQVAGNAAREGLPPDEALKAITATPAEVFGLDGGRIEVGARADLVVWTGDPLEPLSWPERVFIAGEEVSLESRQTRLLDRYRELPGTPAPALAPP